MCGIFGIFSKNQAEIVESELNDVVSRMNHRGPDARGRITDCIESCLFSLAHTRLSIIDLSSSANQPFVINDNFYLVFNGELYNFRELKKELETSGHVFRTNSDTEVLLRAYMEWGENFLYKLDGMFSFIIVDRVKNLVFFARDHLGIKPLYYYVDSDNNLYLGSEIKSFFAIDKVKCQIDSSLLGEYLANMWVAEPDTLFKDIFKLPAGWCGTYGEQGLKLKKYWDLPVIEYNNTNNEQEIIERISTLLQKACAKQLISDVPIGIYISGGLDSTAILQQVYKHNKVRLTGVIAGFDNDDLVYEGTSSDLFYARQLLKSFPEIQSYELILKPEMISYYRDLIWFMDEPIADPAVIPSYLLAKKSRELGCKVMLSGMGGDELFCGYNRFNLIQKTRGIPRWAGSLARMAVKVMGYPLPGKSRKLARDIDRASRFISQPNEIGYQSLIGYFDPKTISKLLNSQDWLIEYGNKYSFNEREDLDQFRKFLYHDFKGFLASHNLIYADKSSMAAGVEVRVPLLDKELVEFVWKLDPSFLMKGGQLKYPLKKILEKDIEPEIIYRKKAGFSAPVRSWINKDIRDEILSLLTNTNSVLYNYIDFKVVQAIIEDQFKKNIDRTMEIWILYTLQLWMETFSLGKVS